MLWISLLTLPFRQVPAAQALKHSTTEQNIKVLSATTIMYWENIEYKTRVGCCSELTLSFRQAPAAQALKHWTTEQNVRDLSPTTIKYKSE